MSEEQLKTFQTMKQNLLTLHRAPSQFKILFHLISRGRSLTIKEIMVDLKMTYKATERAIAKLSEKGLIKHSSFRRGAYYCDLRHIILCILLAYPELYSQYLKKKRT